MILYRQIVFLLIRLNQCMFEFILKYILGWKVKGNYNSFDHLREGKHIIVYTHTSIYDPVLGYMMALIYDLPLIAAGSQEFHNIPIIWRLFNIIFIDRKASMDTTHYISNHLSKYKDFLFAIAPERSCKKVNDIKSDFFHIALMTGSDIHIAHFDFENQVISIEELMNDIIVQTSSYEVIKQQIKEVLGKEKPYYPDACHLVKVLPRKANHTAIINIDRTWLIFLPPACVLMIMVNILSRYYFATAN
jgi:1-acyl-sn-glycerol-3-phosphate acyltransferase